MNRQIILTDLIRKILITRLEFMETRGEEHIKDLTYCKGKVEDLNSNK